MRAQSKTIVALVAASIAFSASPATADVAGPSTIISAGLLTDVTTGPTLAGAQLTGANQTVAGTAPSWTIIDARGTGAAWTLSLSATDFISAAGTTETTVRTIPIAGNLTITPGTITAGAGSDPAPTSAAMTVTAAATSQAVIASGGMAKGTYTLAPTFSMIIPANSYRSNNTVGTTSAGGHNAFISTITYTIQ